MALEIIHLVLKRFIVFQCEERAQDVSCLEVLAEQ